MQAGSTQFKIASINSLNSAVNVAVISSVERGFLAHFDKAQFMIRALWYIFVNSHHTFLSVHYSTFFEHSHIN